MRSIFYSLTFLIELPAVHNEDQNLSINNVDDEKVSDPVDLTSEAYSAEMPAAMIRIQTIKFVNWRKKSFKAVN